MSIQIYKRLFHQINIIIRYLILAIVIYLRIFVVILKQEKANCTTKNRYALLLKAITASKQNNAKVSDLQLYLMWIDNTICS